jgi:hypothetical protein
MAFLYRSVDVICKLFDVLRIRLRCIILEWSVVSLGSRISENLLRQHLSHPADIHFPPSLLPSPAYAERRRNLW